MPPAAQPGRETLADDPPQGVRETVADLLLLLGVEHAQNTIDRLAGIDRVERAHHKMSSLRGIQSNLDRGPVAHFADQDDLGSLAERGAQSAGKAVVIRTELALIYRRLLLRIDEFHRIFQR